MLWRCWLGGRKGIRPVKNWVVGCWRGVCLEQGADLHMAQLMPLPLTVSCFSKIQIVFTFLVPAHPGSPRQRAVKRVCVCVCVCVPAHLGSPGKRAVKRVCVCVCALSVTQPFSPASAHGNLAEAVCLLAWYMLWLTLSTSLCYVAWQLLVFQHQGTCWIPKTVSPNVIENMYRREVFRVWLVLVQ